MAIVHAICFIKMTLAGITLSCSCVFTQIGFAWWAIEVDLFGEKQQTNSEKKLFIHSYFFRKSN